MSRLAPLLFLVVAGCGLASSQSTGASVSVKLPAPEEVAAPGFSAPVTAATG